MRGYADIANLHTRIYAMRSRLLGGKDYQAMLRDPEAPRVVGAHDFVSAKELIFKEQMAGIILLAEAVGKYAPLFIAFLRWYEARNLKLLLAKALGRPVQEQWYDIGPYAVLDRRLLEKGPGLEGIRALLAGTYWEGVFSPRTRPEHVFLQVDARAARGLYEATGDLPHAMQADCRQVILRRIAVMAVMGQWRLREHYQESEERIRAYWGMMQGLFGREVDPQAGIVQEALERHLEAARKSGTLSAADVEHFLEQDYYRWVAAMSHRDFHSGYGVIAYLWLLAVQVCNLFRILDGRRFRVPAEAIRIIGEG